MTISRGNWALLQYTSLIITIHMAIFMESRVDRNLSESTGVY